MEWKLKLTRDLKLRINTLNRFVFLCKFTFGLLCLEKFESIKEVIRSRKSRDRQYNGIKEKVPKR